MESDIDNHWVSFISWRLFHLCTIWSESHWGQNEANINNSQSEANNRNLYKHKIQASIL